MNAYNPMFPTRLDKDTLRGADLRGVDLSAVDGITADQLRFAIVDQTTMMPPGLEHLVRDVPLHFPGRP